MGVFFSVEVVVGGWAKGGIARENGERLRDTHTAKGNCRSGARRRGAR